METIITAAEAAAIIADENAERLPYRVLNASGRATLAAWLDSTASGPQDIDAWIADAERAAGSVLPGEAVIIEMGGASTRSGRPETMVVPDSGFDWTLCD